MSVKEQIDRDLKSALLSDDKTAAMTLRGLKSIILNTEIDKGKRESGLDDAETITLLQKEVKKRHESAELYKKGGSPDKAAAELNEVSIIEKYLPAQISDEQLERLIDQALDETGEPSLKNMGKIIARAKELAGNGADGGRIAAAVKRKVM